MPLLHHPEGALGVHGPLRVDADSLQGLHRALTQLLIVVYHQHIPVRQDHVRLLDHGLEQVHAHVELRPLAQLALHLNGAAHGVHNVLGDGHAQSGALGAADPGVVLPDKGFEDFGLELRGHANAGVLNAKVDAHILLALV